MRDAGLDLIENLVPGDTHWAIPVEIVEASVKLIALRVCKWDRSGADR